MLLQVFLHSKKKKTTILICDTWPHGDTPQLHNYVI